MYPLSASPQVFCTLCSAHLGSLCFTQHGILWETQTLQILKQPKTQCKSELTAAHCCLPCPQSAVLYSWAIITSHPLLQSSFCFKSTNHPLLSESCKRVKFTGTPLLHTGINFEAPTSDVKKSSSPGEFFPPAVS